MIPLFFSAIIRNSHSKYGLINSDTLTLFKVSLILTNIYLPSILLTQYKAKQLINDPARYVASLLTRSDFSQINIYFLGTCNTRIRTAIIKMGTSTREVSIWSNDIWRGSSRKYPWAIFVWTYFRRRWNLGRCLLSLRWTRNSMVYILGEDRYSCL